MWLCYYCRSPLSLEVQKKNRLCPSCGTDIHCCKNCVQYNESLGSKCTEANSPWVADRNSQNSCQYFEFNSTSTIENPESTESVSEAEKAKEAFRALFR